jgi:hypothetical protein
MAVPTVPVAPVVGAVRATVGPTTLTLTVADVTAVPFESVTRAERVVMPVVAGVQLTEYGAVSAVPTMVEPARKSTFETVAPPVALAVAVNVVAAPSAILAPATGAASDTVGTGEETVTLTAVEVTAMPFESTTRAVNETAPAGVAVQDTV